LIPKFVVELATYEKAEHEILATVADIESALFGGNTTSRLLSVISVTNLLALPFDAKNQCMAAFTHPCQN
tara:strand:+ start:550 stop:759 length:210 start_codon:yes stop_codon:yes gene_type:complete